MNPVIDNKTRAVSFFEFHAATMLVVENAGKRYIEVKPLGDLVGMDWRRLRDTVQDGDNAILYGTRRLIPVKFNVVERNHVNQSGIDVSGGPRPPLTPTLDADKGGVVTENPSETGVLHILFERVQMFLARVKTNQMRVQGNESGANYLLTLQIEWAQVLHKYEAGDVVSKKGMAEDASLLMNLMKARAIAKPREVLAYDTMIANAFAAMGYELPVDPQQFLPLEP